MLSLTSSSGTPSISRQPARGLAQVEHLRGLGAEAGDRVQPEQDVLDVLAGLQAGQGRARLQLDRAAVDGEAGQLAAPAEDRRPPDAPAG